MRQFRVDGAAECPNGAAAVRRSKSRVSTDQQPDVHAAAGLAAEQRRELPDTGERPW
jgi:hypothetical protein